MNLIKLLFSLRKSLKGLSDEKNIVIEMSKKDDKYLIKKMYTEDRPDGSAVISNGTLALDDKALAKKIEPEVTRIQEENKKCRAKFV